MRVSFLKPIGLLCCVLLLTHCSLLGPVPYTDKKTYELNAPPPARGKITKAIHVAPMQAYPGLNTERMRYQLQCYEVNYFAKSSWVAPPPAMLQSLLTTHVKQLASRARCSDSDALILKTTLTQFEQRFQKQCSTFALGMQVEILDAKTSCVKTVKQINIVEPAPCANPYGGVTAANQAVNKLFKRIDKLLLNE